MAQNALGVRLPKLSNSRKSRSSEESAKLSLGRHASGGTLGRWSRLHLQSLAPSLFSRRGNVWQAAGREISCFIFITTWLKHVVPTYSGLKVRTCG
jgi:hypothetical protein